MIIDTHAHVVPQSLIDALRSEKRLFPSVRLDAEGAAPRMAFAGGAPGRPIQPRLHDLAQRRDWLKEARVDHQLVGGWTDVYGYELPGEEGADWARFYNEHMRQDAAALPLLSALATVPLQDGARAARVLDEALDAGFKGAMIATQPKGIGGNLDDPSLDPFWEVASARQAAIFLHPHYICSDDRLYFDTVMFEPRALRFLCDVAGADKIMLGSDFPFGIGDPDPCGIVDATPLTAAERRAILGDNAARIFHVECGCGAATAGE